MQSQIDHKKDLSSKSLRRSLITWRPRPPVCHVSVTCLPPVTCSVYLNIFFNHLICTFILYRRIQSFITIVYCIYRTDARCSCAPVQLSGYFLPQSFYLAVRGPLGSTTGAVWRFDSLHHVLYLYVRSNRLSAWQMQKKYDNFIIILIYMAFG